MVKQMMGKIQTEKSISEKTPDKKIKTQKSYTSMWNKL